MSHYVIDPFKKTVFESLIDPFIYIYIRKPHSLFAPDFKTPLTSAQLYHHHFAGLVDDSFALFDDQRTSAAWSFCASGKWFAS